VAFIPVIGCKNLKIVAKVWNNVAQLAFTALRSVIFVPAICGLLTAGPTCDDGRLCSGDGDGGAGWQNLVSFNNEVEVRDGTMKRA
jgi:hypothetical protein